METDDNFTAPASGEETMPGATPEEVLADEIGDVAVEDPERAAQLVSAITSEGSSAVDSPPAGRGDPASPPVTSIAQRAVPAAIVGVLVLQVLPKGRVKRLVLAVLGSALVAGLVAGKPPVTPPGR